MIKISPFSFTDLPLINGDVDYTALQNNLFWVPNIPYPTLLKRGLLNLISHVCIRLWKKMQMPCSHRDDIPVPIFSQIPDYLLENETAVA